MTETTTEPAGRDTAAATDAENGAPPPAPPQPGSVAGRVGRFLLRKPESTIALAGIVLATYFTFANESFLTLGNIRNISQFVIAVAILAVGQTMLLINGELDLSMGSVYYMAPFLVFFATEAGLPLPVAILLALAGASVVGMINATVTIAFGIPSFVVTLGMLWFVNGVTLNLSGGFPKQAPVDAATAGIFGGARYSGFIWAVAIMIVMHLVLTRTRWGTYTIAVGGNSLGAREAGVPASRVRFQNFMMAAVLAGFAGILEGLRIRSFDPGAAAGGERVLQSVAAAVIGGTLLTGGSGTVIGAFIGALVLAILNNGFIIEGVSAFNINMVLGGAIIVAMVVNVVAGRARQRMQSVG